MKKLLAAAICSSLVLSALSVLAMDIGSLDGSWRMTKAFSGAQQTAACRGMLLSASKKKKTFAAKLGNFSKGVAQVDMTVQGSLVSTSTRINLYNGSKLIGYITVNGDQATMVVTDKGFGLSLSTTSQPITKVILTRSSSD